MLLWPVLLLSSNVAGADPFHYSNLIIGDRAMGLGGAYTAVADDASGIYYNPAGIAFALTNDISGSANAYFNRTVTYKKTIFEDDFVENSGSQVPSFFGVLQKLDKYVKGASIAFGTWTIDSDLKDQDDLIKNKVQGTSIIRRFHRTVNQRASTFFAGGSFGYRLGSNFALGFGMNYFTLNELLQDYQDVISSGDAGASFRVRTQNLRQAISAVGLQPAFGLQAALFGELSLGLTVKTAFLLSEELNTGSEVRFKVFDGSEYARYEAGGEAQPVATISAVVENEINKKPLGGWPLEVRAGAAWFASTRFMTSADIAYYGAANSGTPQYVDIGTEKVAKGQFEREPVVNVHLGAEFYVLPTLPLRAGLFTNNDARPDVKKGSRTDTVNCGTSAAYFRDYCSQPDHIDYIGESLFFAWVQPNNQISAGFILQQGSGKAQKKGDDEVQDVEASSSTFAFSVTSNF